MEYSTKNKPIVYQDNKTIKMLWRLEAGKWKNVFNKTEIDAVQRINNKVLLRLTKTIMTPHGSVNSQILFTIEEVPQ
jgi:hypothetical protein